MLYLGIDVSTQSTTIQVIDIHDNNIDDNTNDALSDPSPSVIYEDSVEYTQESRLNAYGLDPPSKLLSSEMDGEAYQPPLLFLGALDIAFEHLHASDINIGDIAAMSISAQQHGHVYLSASSIESFRSLNDMSHNYQHTTLSYIFQHSFSFAHAPIWMFSASQKEAEEIRNYVGSSKKMMAISGSDSPARFTGAVIRYIAKTYPDDFKNTCRIHLLSSVISGILAGREDCPIDWGNGSGMSMMNYSGKYWDDILCESILEGTRFAGTLKNLLPTLASPTTQVGKIADYFVQKYGFNKDCVIAAGSGDNPQSKVAVQGDLLSLGTSFVIMADTSDRTFKPIKDTNAMYDGLGNPFVFGCRTNGALIWDMTRQKLGLSFEDAEIILKGTRIGAKMIMWQAFAESFPHSRQFDATNPINKKSDYAAVIDSSLAIMHYYASDFMGSGTETPLYVTGGPANSDEIMRRVASFWNRPVVRMGEEETVRAAAFGAAVSAYITIQKKPILRKQDGKHIAHQVFEPYIDDVREACDFEKALIEKYTQYVW